VPRSVLPTKVMAAIFKNGRRRTIKCFIYISITKVLEPCNWWQIIYFWNKGPNGTVFKETRLLVTFWGGGSGWTEALVDALQIRSLRASQSHINRTRRAHQITPSFLYKALQEAHMQYIELLEPGTDPQSLEVWCKHQQELQFLVLHWIYSSSLHSVNSVR